MCDFSIEKNNNNNKKGKTPYPRSPNLGAVGSTQEIFTLLHEGETSILNLIQAQFYSDLRN